LFPLINVNNSKLFVSTKVGQKANGFLCLYFLI